ncbi:predicted protein [Sclerotinia sclerotiorum 1980 UF-70]|uniref:Uncharacterized protein n=1 Tax=Sclerotinia sclerotiorum (strain ATCC 18683 / 1980 / Ss-1) TaxID=665079 RepID=A7F5Z7_SCLS1|nr:predicted protein [Sclerotinia sclerotiorum 1980 UF-70]EDN98168.1 predicted protein [Sclerotinia sclerotiorum 1980 UF-70]
MEMETQQRWSNFQDICVDKEWAEDFKWLECLSCARVGFICYDEEGEGECEVR